MAYVIAKPCIGVKDTARVDACPVDCIQPRKDESRFSEDTQLYIDPIECIDCGACLPVCPVWAIFALGDDLQSGRDTPRTMPAITALAMFHTCLQYYSVIMETCSRLFSSS